MVFGCSVFFFIYNIIINLIHIYIFDFYYINKKIYYKIIILKYFIYLNKI